MLQISTSVMMALDNEAWRNTASWVRGEIEHARQHDAGLDDRLSRLSVEAHSLVQEGVSRARACRFETREDVLQLVFLMIRYGADIALAPLHEEALTTGEKLDLIQDLSTQRTGAITL